MKLERKHFLFILRFILGAVFIFAAITKITQPLQFAQDILNYRIVSEDISFWVALILPWIELLCGVFLITEIAIRGSSFLTSGMLLLFIFLILATLIRGNQIDCGCFGIFSHSVTWSLFIQDLILLILSLIIFSSYLKQSPILKNKK